MHKLLITSTIVFIIFSFILNDDYIDITEMVYVSSIGLAYDDNEYTMYTYFINDYALSKSEYNSSDQKSGIVSVIKGKSIIDLFYNFAQTFNLLIDYTHVDSLVIHTSFINHDRLLELINYLKDTPSIYPDFKILITLDNLDKIYKINHINSISSYYTLLTMDDYEFNLKSTSFIDLVNDLTINNYFMLYPSITVIEEDELIKLKINGYFYINKEDKPTLIKFNESPLLYFINNFNQTSITNLNNLYIFNYKICKLYLPNKLILVIYLKSNDDIFNKEFNLNFINYIKHSYYQGIDYYNLNYFKIKIDNVYVKAFKKKI